MLKLRILQKRVERLEELFPKILEGLKKYHELGEEGISDKDGEYLIEYKKTKGKILLDLMQESVFSIENEYLSGLREKLQKLSIHGDPNIPESFLNEADEKFKKAFLLFIEPEFPDGKLEELADDFRMSFSEYDYVWNKVRANLLVIKAGTVPESLERYMKEIRECLSFWRYLAAATLLRTTLEITVEDLCTKNKLDDLSDSTNLNDKFDFWRGMLDKENIESLTQTDINRLSLKYQIDLLCSITKFSSQFEVCHILRKETNAVIHNEIELDRKLAMDLTHRTFQLIHELYEAN